MINQHSDITGLLRAASGGDVDASGQLFELVYSELRRLARRERRRWSGQQTLDTTALIHEAYLKLAGRTDFDNRDHFLGTAATAMRHVLVNYAKQKKTTKRGGQMIRVDADSVVLPTGAPIEELLAIDEALTRMEVDHPRASRVVECRFFAGLDVQATARVLGVSTATVKRDWALGSAWLYRQLKTQPEAGQAEQDR